MSLKGQQLRRRTLDPRRTLQPRYTHTLAPCPRLPSPPRRCLLPHPSDGAAQSSPKSEQRLRTGGGWSAGTGPLHPSRPHIPPPPPPADTRRRDPHAAHLRTAAAAAHRLITSPQRPGARAAERQTPRPLCSQPSPSPPRGPPPPCPPRLPPPQLWPAPPPSPHASHSLSREGGAPSREKNLVTQPAQKWVGF